jgi:hypothetical protein
MYGTSFDAVRRVQDAGKTCILDIEMEVSHLGALIFRPLFSNLPASHTYVCVDGNFLLLRLRKHYEANGSFWWLRYRA